MRPKSAIERTDRDSNSRRDHASQAVDKNPAKRPQTAAKPSQNDALKEMASVEAKKSDRKACGDNSIDVEDVNAFFGSILDFHLSPSKVPRPQVGVPKSKSRRPAGSSKYKKKKEVVEMESAVSYTSDEDIWDDYYTHRNLVGGMEFASPSYASTGPSTSPKRPSSSKNLDGTPSRPQSANYSIVSTDLNAMTAQNFEKSTRSDPRHSEKATFIKERKERKKKIIVEGKLPNAPYVRPKSSFNKLETLFRKGEKLRAASRVPEMYDVSTKEPLRTMQLTRWMKELQSSNTRVDAALSLRHEAKEERMKAAAQHAEQREQTYVDVRDYLDIVLEHTSEGEPLVVEEGVSMVAEDESLQPVDGSPWQARPHEHVSVQKAPRISLKHGDPSLKLFHPLSPALSSTSSRFWKDQRLAPPQAAGISLLPNAPPTSMRHRPSTLSEEEKLQQDAEKVNALKYHLDQRTGKQKRAASAKFMRNLSVKQEQLAKKVYPAGFVPVAGEVVKGPASPSSPKHHPSHSHGSNVAFGRGEHQSPSPPPKHPPLRRSSPELLEQSLESHVTMADTGDVSLATPAGGTNSPRSPDGSPSLRSQPMAEWQYQETSPGGGKRQNERSRSAVSPSSRRRSAAAAAAAAAGRDEDVVVVSPVPRPISGSQWPVRVHTQAALRAYGSAGHSNGFNIGATALEQKFKFQKPQHSPTRSVSASPTRPRRPLSSLL